MFKNLPATTRRFAQKSNPQHNEKIKDSTLCNLFVYKDCNQALITNKIRRLNHEWDIERKTATTASSLLLLSSLMGFKKNKSIWFLATAAVGGLLMQHALCGGSFLLDIFRVKGIRTAQEINNEKTALKIVRGDFNNCDDNPCNLLEKVEKQ